MDQLHSSKCYNDDGMAMINEASQNFFLYSLLQTSSAVFSLLLAPMSAAVSALIASTLCLPCFLQCRRRPNGSAAAASASSREAVRRGRARIVRRTSKG